MLQVDLLIWRLRKMRMPKAMVWADLLGFKK